MADDPQPSGKSSRRIDVFLQRAAGSDGIFAGFLSGIATLLKAGAVAALVALVWVQWPDFMTWLNAVTHLEFSGLKIDRSGAIEKIQEISLTRGDINVDFAKAALVRAELVLPALSGARLLWVDGNPPNNRLEEGILQDMRINVQRALTTPEALNLAVRVDFDLVISNMTREGDTSIPLDRCRAAYFEFPKFPNKDLRADYGNDLNRYNADIQKDPPAGFAMAEVFAQKFPDRFGITQVPRIIFYTLASGGISASQCGRIVTNRPDVLLQSVVSALEELRWQKLVAMKSETKANLR